MKGITITLAIACTTSALAQFGFNDVQYWSGTGSNRAALALKFETGPSAESLVWGYRYDGVVSVETMFKSLSKWIDTTPGTGGSGLGTDPRLFSYGKQFSFGYAIYGIGYDNNSSGVSGWGFNEAPVIDDSTAIDANDNWKVGWNNGFWSLQTAGNGLTPGNWSDASTGISGLNLSNDGWFALAFAPSSAGWSNPVTNGNFRAVSAPVPEPLTIATLGLGVALFSRRRRG
jgi:hypothetical protein